MALAQECKQSLIAEVGRLERTIARLRRSMSLAGTLPAEWRLTPKERDLFLAMIRNDIVTKEMAKVILYGAEERHNHNVDVFVSRIRRKTEARGVIIETINRTGYRLVDRREWAKTLKLGTVE